MRVCQEHPAQVGSAINRFQRPIKCFEFAGLVHAPALMCPVYAVGSGVTFDANRNYAEIPALAPRRSSFEDMVQMRERAGANDAAALLAEVCDSLHMALGGVGHAATLSSSNTTPRSAPNA